MKEKSIIDKEIGEMLKQKRLEAHLTQGELAKKVGISIETYNRFECGRRAFLNEWVITYMKICETLDILPYALYESTKDEK